MNAFDVMHESPWLTFFLLCVALKVIAWPFKLGHRWIRHLDIKAQGWPPVHCDADGDAVEQDEADDTDVPTKAA